MTGARFQRIYAPGGAAVVRIDELADLAGIEDAVGLSGVNRQAKDRRLQPYARLCFLPRKSVVSAI